MEFPTWSFVEKHLRIELRRHEVLRAASPELAMP